MKTTHTFLFIFMFLAVGCQNSLATTEKVSASETSPQISGIIPTPLSSTASPIFTRTSLPSSPVISEGNLEQLDSICQWKTDLYPTTIPMWFSDSKQFIIPKIPEQDDASMGILSFRIGKSEPVWFIKTMSVQETLASTINVGNQVFTYSQGLHVFDKHGEEIDNVKPKNECILKQDPRFLTALNMGLVATGHQVRTSEGGLNNSNEDLFSLLLWDQKDNTCIEIKDEALGYLRSLSASYDGRYISYSFSIRDTETWLWQDQTDVYDLTIQKEICRVMGLNAQFNNRNQIASNNPAENIVFITDLSDCSIQTKIEFDDSTLLWSLSFHPNGYLLAGVSATTIYIWNIKTQEIVYERDFEIPTVVSFPTISFSPDGRFLLVTKPEDYLGKDKIILLGVLEE